MIVLPYIYLICAIFIQITLCDNEWIQNLFTLIANNIAGQPPIVFPSLPPIKNIISESYDFIIVGSGSSGAVLASRLSEITAWKILLLEAGQPANTLTTIPLLAPVFQLTEYNWNFHSEPETNACLGFYKRKCVLPRGKALGGSSVINYMIYTRGNYKDYDNFNIPNWSAQEIFPYFLKSEQCHLENFCTNGAHNKSGILHTQFPFQSELNKAFIKAGQELGSKSIDYNSWTNLLGFGQLQATQNHGRRHNVYDAFIRPIQKTRKNLKIITGARVTKILIDPITKTTNGVIFYKNNKKFMVKSKKEVIISAGTFLSPQLLMLSGIGPKTHLKQLNIPLIKNLPVGETMYDHIAYLGLSFRINQTIEPKYALLNPLEIINFQLNGKGIYTSLAGIEGIAYINTGVTNTTPNYPDIELLFVGAGSLETDLGLVVANELNINQTIYNKVFKPLEPYPVWSIFPVLLHPKSKGFLKLNSTNPFDPPLLYTNYFTDIDKSDIKTMLASIRYIQKLSQTKAFQKYNSQIHTIPIPGCEYNKYDSDEYWECALRHLTGSIHHQIGTCKMGIETDPEAVVDSRLRVFGIKGLRVVDSSVIPRTISAHTNAPAIMIGEKASDFIKTDWNV